MFTWRTLTANMDQKPQEFDSNTSHTRPKNGRSFAGNCLSKKCFVRKKLYQNQQCHLQRMQKKQYSPRTKAKHQKQKPSNAKLPPMRTYKNWKLGFITQQIWLFWLRPSPATEPRAHAFGTKRRSVPKSNKNCLKLNGCADLYSRQSIKLSLLNSHIQPLPVLPRRGERQIIKNRPTTMNKHTSVTY